MTNLTQWKEEAREKIDSLANLDGELEVHEVNDFLDTLIDRIHAHTLEEVRGKVEGMKAKEWAGFDGHRVIMLSDTPEMTIYNSALKDILAALELLEHPTD